MSHEDSDSQQLQVNARNDHILPANITSNPDLTETSPAEINASGIVRPPSPSDQSDSRSDCDPSLRHSLPDLGTIPPGQSILLMAYSIQLIHVNIRLVIPHFTWVSQTLVTLPNNYARLSFKGVEGKKEMKLYLVRRLVRLHSLELTEPCRTTNPPQLFYGLMNFQLGVSPPLKPTALTGWPKYVLHYLRSCLPAEQSL